MPTGTSSMTSGSTAEEGGASGVGAPRARFLPPGGGPHALRVAAPDAPSAPAAEVDRSERSSVLVLGLGNPLLGDDAVGWRVVEELERLLASPGPPPEADGRVVETDMLAVGGIGLMERLAGAPRAILVDAIETGDDPPGTVGCRRLSEIPIRAATHLDGTHDMPLPVALAAGRALGAEIPAEILVVSIEARRTDVFSTDLTPDVAAAVPRAVHAILTAIAAG